MRNCKTTHEAYAVYSYRLAKRLLRQGCIISDIDHGKRRGQLLFRFIDGPALRKALDAERDRKEILEILNDFADKSEREYGYWTPREEAGDEKKLRLINQEDIQMKNTDIFDGQSELNPKITFNVINSSELKKGMLAVYDGEIVEIQHVIPGEERGLEPGKYIIYYTKPEEEKRVEERIAEEIQEILDQENEADKAKRERVYTELKDNGNTPRSKPEMARFCDLDEKEFSKHIRVLIFEGRVKEENASYLYGDEFCLDEYDDSLYVWKCID